MPSRRRPLSRFIGLPIRARLTIAFAGVMAAVLAAAGSFLYSQFERDLNAQVNSALVSDAQDVKALVEVGRQSAITTSGLGLAQIYDSDGRIVGSSLRARHLRLLTPAEAAHATRRPKPIDKRTLPFGTVRVRAFPARAQNGTLRAVAVAISLRSTEDELADLRTLLLISGPLALLLASVAGHELARAALRPVDHMRALAERITERQLSERLPIRESADEVAALGRTLNAMLDRIESAVARERRLVSDASHELRTPLTTLRAELDLALMGQRSPAELHAAIRSAADEAQRMSRLADDLLVLARADQGRLPLHQEPLTALELLDAAGTRARAAAEMSGRTIAVRGAPSADGVVQADPDRAAQMLDNLITNSLRYGDGAITLSARRDGDYVELHVSDEGSGFSDELIGQPFERFARGSEARAHEPGSGLGLAIVEALAIAHGGYASARNRPEGGADVWFALPTDHSSRSR
jgi:two-component system OmpR family sensor kinase